MTGADLCVKRFFDIAVVLFAAPLWAPLAAAVAAAVRAFDGAPALFRQTRAGLGGRPFEVLKFRTMADGRVTRLGAALRRLSLDELPQLVNVLKGDMSLVGPRPLPLAYLPRYTAEQARRHAVRPGITGWAQVHGRNAISWDEKFAYDVEYVDRRNLWLDLKILLMTLPLACAGGDEMEEFRGT